MSGVERGQGVGIPVWRWHGEFHTGRGVRKLNAQNEPGRWFPTDEASLAQTRERLEHAIEEAGYWHPDQADAVMRLLFGQDTT